MAEASSRKCRYFKSGYCKFTRKQNGCRYVHPAETCKVPNCRDKECPLKHLRSCKNCEQCKYQTKCMYQHSNTRSHTKNSDEDTKKT